MIGVRLSTRDVLRFEDFRLDRRGGLFRLRESGRLEAVVLGSRAMDVLTALAEHAGEVVTKQALMAAAWPGLAVEDSNLTVQISTLRRVLDEGRDGASCIQTVIGRGYRFLPSVTTEADDDLIEPVVPAQETAEPPFADTLPPAGATAEEPARPVAAQRFRSRLLMPLLTLVLVAFVGLGGLMAWRMWGDGETRQISAPRLSIVVLPFQNLGGDAKDDYRADGITDDLTTDLSHIPGAFVIARESAYTYKGKATDVRQIGRELGVRYVLEGSVRRLDSRLRVNVQLISTETGAHLWSDRFDEEIGELAAGQEQVVTRMKDGLGISMVEIESARSLRERPTNPDAFDLILRARSLQLLPQNLERDQQALALYERALLLDPSSVPALVRTAYFLLETRPSGDWGSFENMQRAERLLAQARALAPGSAEVLNTAVYWLRSVGRCEEVIEATQHAIQTDPNRMRMWTAVYNSLAICKTWTGHAEEEITLQATADQLNPRSPWKFSRYNHMAFASLMLGRDQDAINFLQRSLAINPEVHGGTNAIYRWLAAAYARTGQMEEARRSLAAADRLWPYDTVRSHFPDNASSTVYAEQVRAYQAGLRRAGERDHADEDADFGVPADGALQSKVAGLTPMDAPGSRTIRTADLVRFLGEARPIVIDTVSNSWGRSFPGAVGL